MNDWSVLQENEHMKFDIRTKSKHHWALLLYGSCVEDKLEDQCRIAIIHFPMDRIHSCQLPQIRLYFKNKMHLLRTSNPLCAWKETNVSLLFQALRKWILLYATTSGKCTDYSPFLHKLKPLLTYKIKVCTKQTKIINL